MKFYLDLSLNKGLTEEHIKLISNRMVPTGHIFRDEIGNYIALPVDSVESAVSYLDDELKNLEKSLQNCTSLCS